jgi:hypothetical protein
VTAGQRHESPEAIPLLMTSLDRMWPDGVAGDTGDSATDLRNCLQAHDLEAVIPYRDDEAGDRDYDHEADRERPSIEWAINRLTRYRRITTRYENLARSSLAMLTMPWLTSRLIGRPDRRPTVPPF